MGTFFLFPANKPGTTFCPGLRDGPQPNTGSLEELVFETTVVLSLEEDCLGFPLF